MTPGRKKKRLGLTELTLEKKVALIRDSLALSYRMLAEKYGVALGTVAGIIKKQGQDTPALGVQRQQRSHSHFDSG